MFFWGLHWWNHFDSILWRQRKQSYYTLEINEIRNRGILALIENFHKVKKMWNSYIELENSSRRLIPWNGGLILKCGESGSHFRRIFRPGWIWDCKHKHLDQSSEPFVLRWMSFFQIGIGFKGGIVFCTYAMKKTCRHLFDTNSNYPFLASKQMIAASINWMQYLFDCTFSFRAFAEVFCQQVAGPEIRHVSIYQSPYT